MTIEEILWQGNRISNSTYLETSTIDELEDLEEKIYKVLNSLEEMVEKMGIEEINKISKQEGYFRSVKKLRNRLYLVLTLVQNYL